MRRLDRYVLTEILSPLGLGFLIYTAILLIQFLFRSAEMIIRRGVPTGMVGGLLLNSLPNIVVLTIPMALLFGILVAVGRMSSNSELTALRSSGISLFYLYRPVLLLSLILTLVTGGFMLYLLPRGNTALQNLYLDILTRSATQQVEPRVFYDDWEGLVIYVFEVPPGENIWKGVFVARSRIGTDNDVTIAESGRVRMDPEGSSLLLELENAVSHRVDLNRPEEYHVSSHRRVEQILIDRYAEDRAERRAFRSLRSLTVGELRGVLREPDLRAERRNLARVEIHKRFAIPAVCVVFGLLALPLGFGNQRGGNSSGFAISIVVIMLYYVLLNNGEDAARLGKLEPWLAMWLPNLAFLIIGLALLARRNRDKSLYLTSALGRVQDGLRRLGERFKRRREAAARQTVRAGDTAGPATARVVVRLPRLRLRFPNIMDRYVMRLFFQVLLLVSAAVLSLAIIADLTERIDDIMKNDIALRTVLEYYQYASLQIFFELAPVIVLVTTLIVFGLLSRTNEVIAAKTLGLSLYRLSLPTLMGALIVSALTAFMQARVLPVTNEWMSQIANEIRGLQMTRGPRRADRNWLFGQGRYIYNYLHYDEQEQSLQRLQVFEFDKANRVTRRFYATKAAYAGDGWRAEQAWVRSFDGRTPLTYRSFSEPVLVDYPETPEYFEENVKRPIAMSYTELEEYIRELEASGKKAPELKVELQNKIGYPFISLVMGLVALPFSFRLGRRGALYGIGLGVVLGMIFLGVFAFSRTLGETATLPPALAIWSPSLAFGLLAVYLFLYVDT